MKKFYISLMLFASATMWSGDIADFYHALSKKTIRAQKLTTLYKKCWQESIQQGKSFTIKSIKDFDTIINEDTLKMAPSLCQPKNLTSRSYPIDEALFIFLKELHSATLLCEKENNRLGKALQKISKKNLVIKKDLFISIM
ncbi:MAG TPA: hypothetical protein VGW78_02330 [Candidatus Babeliales bacterium]|jgi:hypothetical protein|nr:hypothetical protein [Candidatus Babeliales bacterium]